MTNSEQKPKASVTAIWTEAVLEGEVVRVSIVNGTARILIGGFDIHVPGRFDGDVNEVLAAYKRQVEKLEIAFANLPSVPDEPSRSEPNCGLIPLTTEELDQQVEEFMKQRGNVIDLKTGEWE